MTIGVVQLMPVAFLIMKDLFLRLLTMVTFMDLSNDIVRIGTSHGKG